MMHNQHPELISLGWSNWLEERANCNPHERIARVAAVDRGQLILIDQTGTFRAKIAGSFYYQHNQTHELPCVGDWVCFEKHSADDFGLIHSVIERRTSLRRKAAGDAIEFQMIAANVDYVFIVQSCEFDFNINRLERYLVMVRDGSAEPYILLTKTDLIKPDDLNSQISAIQSADISVPIMTLSNVTQEGINDVKQLLQAGKTYCFVGSSGVGKSTLINQLVGKTIQETKTVSGTGEGRHTTVRRELIILDNDALVIDNPGMREFGIIGADESIGDSFTDITRIATNCRYRDCTHTSEPGCAVIEALNSGEISQQHYENFIKLKKESDFYDMSYAEKRKKNRDFGKFIKSVKKDLNKK